VLELTGTWARWSKVAMFAGLLLLAAAVLGTYWAAGSGAALVLLASASTILLALATVVARRRLRRADERSRLGEQALDAVPHAIFVVDALRPGGANVYVNAAYCALTGYGVHEAVDAGFDALAIFVEPEVAVLAEGPSRRRVNIRRRDGTTFPAKLELRALPRHEGGRYVVGLLEGIGPGERATDRKSGMRIDAPQTSADAGHAKDAFLSWLSHELRSPLNACVMWLDVLALSPQPDKLTKAVETIKRNLARQARLVSDLDDAARISSGRLELRLEPLDVVALLKGGLDAWQLLAIGKQLTFHHHIEPEVAPVSGDSERLFQALNHLLENAIGGTPHGGRVDLRVRTLNGNCVIEVEDTGVALSPEDAANLAVPLWRGPASAKTRSGLGLGLAVAHHVATKHGGSLTAASGESGARFVLTLPLAASGRERDALAQTDRTSGL
jgi:signal transduction histidine kinase